MRLQKPLLPLACAILMVSTAMPVHGYGPLGHMRVVVDNWNDFFAPQLNNKSLLDKDLLFAALAGAVSSDMGYVISDARPFTDSVHYVRSGDFVAALVQNAKSGSRRADPRLLAFALGFETHYWADRFGHYSATNVLVARIKKAEFVRVTYEHDPCMHTWVETQLSLLDLRDSPGLLTSGFVDAIDKMHGEQDAFLFAAHQLIRDTMEQIFPGTQLAFRAYDLYRFLRFVSLSFSLTQQAANKMFGAVPWVDDKSFAKTRESAQRNSDEASALAILQDDLWHSLPAGIGPVEPVYHRSLENVARNMREHHAALQNFNLDTDLPSMAGQYHCADAAVHLVMANLASSSAGTSNPQAVQDFRRFESSYDSAGATTRTSLSLPVGDQPQNLLADHSEIKTAIDRSLFDIPPLADSALKPVTVVSSGHCPPGKGMQYQLGDQSFTLHRATATVCVPEKARALQALYGVQAAGELISAPPSANPEKDIADSLKEIRPHYLEAIDRTRLDDNVSGYTTTPCPECMRKIAH